MMYSRIDGTSKMLRGVVQRKAGHVRRCRSAGRCLLSKSFAESLVLLLARRLVHASLSCLTAAMESGPGGFVARRWRKAGKGAVRSRGPKPMWTLSNL